MDKRRSRRVVFTSRVRAWIRPLDENTFFECTLADVSETGAAIGCLEGTIPAEFWLVLSSSPKPPVRRCLCVWQSGNRAGVMFESALCQAGPPRSGEDRPDIDQF
jgi:hypothetical protein